MGRSVLIICAMIIFTSCGKSDDLEPNSDVNCGGWIDFAGPPSLKVVLVDDEGNNLIESGFFKATEISASVNGVTTESEVVKSDSIRLHPISFLNEASVVETHYRWLLELSNSDTDTLDYVLSFEEVKSKSGDILYCGTRNILDSATYNGIPFDIKKDAVQQVLPLTVIKAQD